jgi:hypothetical protein
MYQSRGGLDNMPSIIPSYVYSLFAALIVGTIVLYACSLSTVNIRNEAATQQLSNIDEYVATQSLSLLSHTTEDKQNSTLTLDIPSDIGNEIFWVRINNDSSNAWVESGFGTNATVSQTRMCLPVTVVASGTFVSGSGQALLECHFENNVATLTLTKE